MPSIKCHCGNLITLGAIPSENKFHLIADVEVEKLISIIGNNQHNEYNSFEAFYNVAQEVAKCSACKRIWVDENNDGNWDSYNREASSA